jgi:hypothetical protein
VILKKTQANVEKAKVTFDVETQSYFRSIFDGRRTTNLNIAFNFIGDELIMTPCKLGTFVEFVRINR